MVPPLLLLLLWRLVKPLLLLPLPLPTRDAWNCSKRPIPAVMLLKGEGFREITTGRTHCARLLLLLLLAGVNVGVLLLLLLLLALALLH